MSASGKAGWDTIFAPRVDGFPKAILNDLSSVRALIHSKTVAVTPEPIQGEVGGIPASLEFIQVFSRTLCDEHNLLLIVDEVQTGCGRTGTLFAYEQYGVEPDMMTLREGLGGGRADLGTTGKESCCCFEYGDQGGTFSGTPLITAAGVAVIRNIISRGMLTIRASDGAQLADELVAISKEFGLGEVRGAGALLALELGRDIGADVVTAARAKGLLLNAPRPHCLRFMPALNSTPAEIVEGLGLLRQVLKELA